MTKREEYDITFQIKTDASGNIFETVTSTNSDNLDIAFHIAVSNQDNTEIQIDSLQDAIDGKRIQEHWGEVMGSQLEIFQQEGTVQVGYTNRRIPIEDFKQLLEEWLQFITT